MDKRFVMSVVVMIVMLIIFGYLVHGVLLAEDYKMISNLYRAKPLYAFMLPAHILAAIAFVWLYRRGQDGGSYLTQGVLFGLAVAAVMIVHKFMIYYTLQPIPGVLAFKQIVFDTIATVVMGIVVAFLNAKVRRRPGDRPA